MRDGWLTCEVSYDFKLRWDRRQAVTHFNRKIMMRWVAVGYGPHGLFTEAVSPEFEFQWVTHPRDLEPTFEASRALMTLTQQLIGGDWTELPKGSYWFSRRFRRPLPAG
jgi:hypothetical protein